MHKLEAENTVDIGRSTVPPMPDIDLLFDEESELLEDYPDNERNDYGNGALLLGWMAAPVVLCNEGNGSQSGPENVARKFDNCGTEETPRHENDEGDPD